MEQSSEEEPRYSRHLSSEIDRYYVNNASDNDGEAVDEEEPLKMGEINEDTGTEECNTQILNNLERCKNQMIGSLVRLENTEPEMGNKTVYTIMSFCNHNDLDDEEIMDLVRETWMELDEESARLMFPDTVTFCVASPKPQDTTKSTHENVADSETCTKCEMEHLRAHSRRFEERFQPCGQHQTSQNLTESFSEESFTDAIKLHPTPSDTMLDLEECEHEEENNNVVLSKENLVKLEESRKNDEEDLDMLSLDVSPVKVWLDSIPPHD